MQRIALYCLLAIACCSTPLLFAGHNKAPRVHCPKCHHECKVEVSKEDVKKHCWNVECKTICIPRVTFPWQVKKHGCQDCCNDPCCCPPPARCAKTRTIHVLKKHEYECERCKYKWTPCNTCGDHCCEAGRCTGSISDTYIPSEPAPTPEPAAAPAQPMPISQPTAQRRPTARITDLPVGTLPRK